MADFCGDTFYPEYAITNRELDGNCNPLWRQGYIGAEIKAKRGVWGTEPCCDECGVCCCCLFQREACGDGEDPDSVTLTVSGITDTCIDDCQECVDTANSTHVVPWNAAAIGGGCAAWTLRTGGENSVDITITVNADCELEILIADCSKNLCESPPLFSATVTDFDDYCVDETLSGIANEEAGCFTGGTATLSWNAIPTKPWYFTADVPNEDLFVCDDYAAVARGNCSSDEGHSVSFVEGSGDPFEVGETVTAAGGKAGVLASIGSPGGAAGTLRYILTGNQFADGDEVTGGTSGRTASILGTPSQIGDIITDDDGGGWVGANNGDWIVFDTASARTLSKIALAPVGDYLILKKSLPIITGLSSKSVHAGDRVAAMWAALNDVSTRGTLELIVPDECPDSLAESCGWLLCRYAVPNFPLWFWQVNITILSVAGENCFYRASLTVEDQSNLVPRARGIEPCLAPLYQQYRLFLGDSATITDCDDGAAIANENEVGDCDLPVSENPETFDDEFQVFPFAGYGGTITFTAVKCV